MGLLPSIRKIIHFQALCSITALSRKQLCGVKYYLLHVMTIASKIINSCQEAPLQQRLFKVILADIEHKEHDLILHTEVPARQR